jgi:hypothetical protein
MLICPSAIIGKSIGQTSFMHFSQNIPPPNQPFHAMGDSLQVGVCKTRSTRLAPQHSPHSAPQRTGFSSFFRVRILIWEIYAGQGGFSLLKNAGPRPAPHKGEKKKKTFACLLTNGLLYFCIFSCLQTSGLISLCEKYNFYGSISWDVKVYTFLLYCYLK